MVSPQTRYYLHTPPPSIKSAQTLIPILSREKWIASAMPGNDLGL
jgi:hypothetical protein